MRTHQFIFKGTAKEYFGIWIVNVLLSIVTLGIYGAWAKVRDKKYMATHTELDGHNFDYHATGKQIFIGRLIVLGILLGLYVLNRVNPLLYFVGVLALLCILPFIVIRALRFNARVSSYRNVRFDFFGGVKQAIVTYVLLRIGNVFTFYLCTPFFTRASHRFVTNNSKYGDRDFEFDTGIGNYYAPFCVAIGLVFGGFILMFILIGAGLMMSGLVGDLAELGKVGATATEEQIASVMVMMIALYAVMILVFVPAVLVYRAWTRNVHFNNTVLDGQHHFESNVRLVRYIWIVFSNAVVSIFSLGLMIPWGRVRMAKYMASVTFINTQGSLDGYASQVQETAGVLSSEYMDMEGFDIDIGL